MACGGVVEFLRGDLGFFWELCFNGVTFWNESRDHLIVYNLIMNDACFKEQDDSTHHEPKRMTIIEKISTSKSLLHNPFDFLFSNKSWPDLIRIFLPHLSPEVLVLTVNGLAIWWLEMRQINPLPSQKRKASSELVRGFPFSLYRKPLIAIKITAVFAAVATFVALSRRSSLWFFGKTARKAPPVMGFGVSAMTNFARIRGLR